MEVEQKHPQYASQAQNKQFSKAMFISMPINRHSYKNISNPLPFRTNSIELEVSSKKTGNIPIAQVL